MRRSRRALVRQAVSTSQTHQPFGDFEPSLHASQVASSVQLIYLGDHKITYTLAVHALHGEGLGETFFLLGQFTRGFKA